jgi:hypothetical protein
MALSAMNHLLNRKNINQRKPQNGNWKKKPNIANYKRQFGIKAANPLGDMTCCISNLSHM